MANVDLYDASDIFVSGHTTIQSAVTAASSGYKVKIGDKGTPYYEVISLISGITVEAKTGENPVISGAIEILATSPSGSWTFHATVSGRSVYRYSYTANNNEVNGVYQSSDTRLFTYETYADLTGFDRGEGIYFDNPNNRLYIILGATGTGNPNSTNLRISAANHVFLFSNISNCTVRNLELQIAGEGCVKFLDGADNNTVSNCILKLAKWGAYFRNDGGGADGNIIEDCTIVDTRKSTWTWTQIKASPMEGSGIKQAIGGLSNIFRRNQISGFFNGINVNKTDSSTPYVNGNLIYENVMHDIMDDGIEIENYCRNIEIFQNEIYDCYNGVSMTPHYDGPTYFYRNKITADKDSNGSGRCWKGSDGQTRNNIKIYHNVMTANGNVFPMGNATPSELTNIEVYNNIFLVEASKFAINGSPLHTETGNEYDGNIYYRISGSGNLLKDFDKNNGQERADLDAFRASAEGIASGWETNGLDQTDGNPFIDLDSYPYPMTITSGSSIAIDNGVALPASFPDRTAYNGDLTIGWQPYNADPGIPVKSSGLIRTVTNTSIGNQTFRDSQLHTTPNAAMFIITSAITDGTASSDSVLGIGFATSTSERVAICQWDDDAVGTTATRRRSIEDGCIFVITSTGTITAQADFVQFDADVGSGAGVTINWTDAPDAAYLITVILFDATNAKVGTFLTPASNGGAVAPSIGFQANVFLFIAASGAIPDSSATALLSFGIAGGNLTQRCWVTRSANGVADTDVSSQFLNNRVSARLQSGGTVLNATELTAVGATDFTITQRTGAGGTDEVGYLALQFDDENYWIGDTDTPTAIGTQTITTPTFYPQLVILGLTNTEAANTAYNDNKAGSIGIGAFTSYNSFSNVIYTEDAAATTVSKSLSDDLAINLPDDDGTVQNLASFIQFTSTGWQLNHTNVAGTAKKVFAFALEGPAASTTTIAPISRHYHIMRRR
jgi:hypothetical protein